MTLDDIQQMTLAELGQTVMPFGKYGLKNEKGPFRFDDIPMHYLVWLQKQGYCRGDLQDKLDCYLKHPMKLEEIYKQEQRRL